MQRARGRRAGGYGAPEPIDDLEEYSMTTRTRAAVAKTATICAATAIGLTALAAPAYANSFTQRVYQGTVSYDDGHDQFCVHADETNINDRAVIDVTLTPYDLSRGPVVHVSDIDTPGGQCASLATAYEDTHYQAVIKSLTHFDRLGGSTYQTTKVSFYS
jgi:hypothetical protein